MMEKGPITATFIDEITYDMPSSNWSPEQWVQDLDYMAEIGIDTLVFMRGGFEDKTIFPSKVFGTEYTYDLAGLILEEAAKRFQELKAQRESKEALEIEKNSRKPPPYKHIKVSLHP